MDSTWLKIQFKANPEKTKADLAEFVGLGAPAISKILAGMRQIKAAEYVKMREFFGLPSDGQSSVAAKRGYKISNLQQANLKESGEEGAGDWVIPSSIIKNKSESEASDIKAFSVNEDAMAPDFPKGCHVLVDIADNRPSPSGIFIIKDGMGHVIRRCSYITGSDPFEVSIVANSKYIEPQKITLEALDIVGRVIAKLEWV